MAAIETILQDLRHGIRMLVKNPAFTIVAVLSLAIGIGANTATFSLADLLLFRPLPLPDPDRVVTVGSLNVAATTLQNAIQASYPDYLDVRDRSESFDGLTATLITQAQISVQDEMTPQVRTGAVVSGNYFRAMHVEPSLGRGFLPEEDQVPRRNPVIVLSRSFWEQQFGADPGVLGRSVRLDGLEYSVVGVAPEEFTGTDQWIHPEFYVPIMMWPALVPDGQPDPLQERGQRALTLKGRLADGVSIEQARAEVARIGDVLAETYPETNENYEWLVRSEFETRTAAGGVIEIVVMLMTLSAAVLIVACANVAGLLASRAPVRSGEVALRLAIGAGRARIIRQLFTENLLLALMGALAGLGVGYLGILLWRQMRIVTDLPIELTIQLDQRALVFSIMAAVLSVFLFGLIPSIQTARRSLTGLLRNATGGAARRRLLGRSFLVVGQVSISLVLLSVGGFMYGSLGRLVDAGPGFRTDHLLMISLDPGMSRYDLPRSRQLYDQLVEQSGQLSGVESVALASFIPLSTTGASITPVAPEGHEFPEGIQTTDVLTSYVDESYFDAMNIPIVAGRPFLAADSEDTPRIAIVNEQFAGLYWPGESAIGRRFRITGNRGPWVEIVGVVPTGKYFSITEDSNEFIYMPYSQNPRMQMTLLVETTGDPIALVDPLRGVVSRLDPSLAASSLRTMEEFYRDSAVANTLVVIQVISVMGAMGVILAFVGLYGLVAYGVSTRTREFGIRMAIGAKQGDILRIVLKQGLILAAIGVLIGLMLTFGADIAMRAFFPGGGGNQRGVADYIPFTLLLLAVTALAAYLPARRAARVQPAIALHHE
jgi:putative ABC transport system permease protein